METYVGLAAGQVIKRIAETGEESKGYAGQIFRFLIFVERTVPKFTQSGNSGYMGI